MDIDKYTKDSRIICNIYGANDELLVGVGTPINERIKEHLKFRKWYLEKPSTSIYENIALLDDSFNSIIDNKTINTRRIIEKAKQIVDLIRNNPIIYSNLSRIKEYDEYTYDHSYQVAYLAVAMGINLGLPSIELINLSIAGLTHDIGKCVIDPKIINKPGKLSPEERFIVEKHSEYGYALIEEALESIDPSVAKTILYHHENYDGTGYPHGLKGMEIPKEASIIHVCDVFDALVSERPYKQRLSEYDSLNILKDGRGTKFNPRVIDVFFSSMHIYKIGSVIELDNGIKVVITNIIKDENDNVLEVHFEELNTGKRLINTLPQKK